MFGGKHPLPSTASGRPENGTVGYEAAPQTIIEFRLMNSPAADIENGELVKEAIGHLRTIHFSLALVCFALLATSTLAKRSLAEKALPQLREIMALVNEDGGLWREAYLPGDPIVSLNGLVRGDPFGTTLVVPFNRLWLVNDSGQLRIPGQSESIPNTLQEFGDSWNLLRDQTLILASRPRDDATLQLEDSAGNKERIPIYLVPALVDPDSVVASVSARGDTAYDLIMTDSPLIPDSIVEAIRSAGRSQDYGTNAGSHDTFSSAITWWTVDEKTQQSFRIFDTLTFGSARERLGILGAGLPFEAIYPELAKAASSTSELAFSTVEDLLLTELRQEEETLDLFGARVPAHAFAAWGAPVLIAIQLYLLLHLRQLIRLVPAPRQIPQHPWVAIYNDNAARWLTGLSAVLLPPAVISTLLIRGEVWRDVPTFYVLVALLVLSCSLAWLTFVQLLVLWRMPMASRFGA